MNKVLRHGDLAFKRVDQAVTGKSLKQLTIAEGEVTGHHHVLIAEVGSQIIGDNSVFEVKGKAKLVHPEHKTINFDSGVYVVIHEHEYDYAEESMRQVID